MGSGLVVSEHALLLRPTGRLDADSCSELRQQLAAAFTSGFQSIAVDMSGVSRVDLTGLRVLAGAARHLRKRRGLLVVTHASRDVATMMRINNMGELLELQDASPLRVVAGSGSGGAAPRPRRLTVIRPGA